MFLRRRHRPAELVGLLSLLLRGVGRGVMYVERPPVFIAMGGLSVPVTQHGAALNSSGFDGEVHYLTPSCLSGQLSPHATLRFHREV